MGCRRAQKRCRMRRASVWRVVSAALDEGDHPERVSQWLHRIQVRELCGVVGSMLRRAWVRQRSRAQRNCGGVARRSVPSGRRAHWLTPECGAPAVVIVPKYRRRRLRGPRRGVRLRTGTMKAVQVKPSDPAWTEGFDSGRDLHLHRVAVHLTACPIGRLVRRAPHGTRRSGQGTDLRVGGEGGKG